MVRWPRNWAASRVFRFFHCSGSCTSSSGHASPVSVVKEHPHIPDLLLRGHLNTDPYILTRRCSALRDRLEFAGRREHLAANDGFLVDVGVILVVPHVDRNEVVAGDGTIRISL